MKVTIIATGNEITSGQTINTNGSWAAQELTKMGFDVSMQLLVQDSESEIKWALDEGFSKTDFIINIGGLGPTKDDLTRKIVSEHFGEPLFFNEEMWTVLKAQLIEYGVTPRKGHEWQCYFPKKAKIIDNPVGTASGFYLNKNSKYFLALPGPPNEFKAVFKNMKNELMKMKGKSFQQESWLLIDVPESEVSHHLEPLVEQSEGRSLDYPLEIGFKASPPFVQVKLMSYEDGVDPINETIAFNEIEKFSSQYLFAKNISSYWDLVQDLINQKSIIKKIVTIDPLTNGLIYFRQKELSLDSCKLEAVIGESTINNMEQDFTLNDAQTLLIKISKNGEIKLYLNGNKKSFVVPTPKYGRNQKGRRYHKYVREYLAKFIYEFICELDC